MPPKKHPETPEEQAKRFQKEARKLAKDGSLDPAEADKALDSLLAKEARRSHPPARDR